MKFVRFATYYVLMNRAKAINTTLEQPGKDKKKPRKRS